MPKGGRRSTQKKGKRVEEGLDESFENQSIASSQGSFDTQSNPTDDVESTDELGTEGEEVETNFEQVLEENIEGATEKNAKLRQTSMKAISGTFAKHLIADLVAERKDTIVDIIERSLKRGQAEDQVCAGPLAALLCVQLGYGSDSEHIFKLLKSPLLATLQDPTARVPARASCGSALALCCFLASDEHEDLVECVTALQNVFSSSHTAAKSDLFCECLFSWALLLSIAPDSLVEECVEKQCRKIIKLMQHDNVNLRIAAGEVFALICELGREKIEDFEPQQFGVLDILKDLATDGTKHRAKKDRRQQRSSFRDILRTIESFITLHMMFHFDSCESMQKYTFDDSCRLHRSLQNRLCHNEKESDSCRFVNTVWNYKDPIIRKDYSSNQNNPSIFPADCFKMDRFMEPELDFLDAILHESSYGMEFLNEKDIIDLGLTQNVPTLEDDSATISDLDLAKTTGCYKSGYHVDQVGLDYFDDNFGDYNNLLWEDTQEFYGTVNKTSNGALSKSVPPVSHVHGRLQAKSTKLLILATSLDEGDICKRLKDRLEDEDIKTIRLTNNNKRNNASCEDVHELSKSQCSLYELIKTQKSFVEADGYNSQTVERSGLKREHEEEKDERYWKRRINNNAAAKKSRAAKKDRIAVMEKRIKELEVENAGEKEYLRTLEQKVLEKEGK